MLININLVGHKSNHEFKNQNLKKCDYTSAGSGAYALAADGLTVIYLLISTCT